MINGLLRGKPQRYIYKIKQNTLVTGHVFIPFQKSYVILLTI